MGLCVFNRTIVDKTVPKVALKGLLFWGLVGFEFSHSPSTGHCDAEGAACLDSAQGMGQVRKPALLL